MKNIETEIFELISFGGNARALAFDALKEAENENFSEAKKLMEEAEAELNKAHNTQTKLIQSEINGEEFEKSLLLIHAQDHLMTAISEQGLIRHMIRILEKVEEKMKGEDL